MSQSTMSSLDFCARNGALSSMFMAGSPCGHYTPGAVISTGASSLRLDVRLPGNLGPFVDLLGEPGIELRRSIAPGVDAERACALREFRRVDHGADIGREPVQHRRRNSRRADHRVEGDDVESRKALRDG